MPHSRLQFSAEKKVDCVPREAHLANVHGLGGLQHQLQDMPQLRRDKPNVPANQWKQPELQEQSESSWAALAMNAAEIEELADGALPCRAALHVTLQEKEDVPSTIRRNCALRQGVALGEKRRRRRKAMFERWGEVLNLGGQSAVERQMQRVEADHANDWIRACVQDLKQWRQEKSKAVPHLRIRDVLHHPVHGTRYANACLTSAVLQFHSITRHLRHLFSQSGRDRGQVVSESQRVVCALRRGADPRRLPLDSFINGAILQSREPSA
mmetsp:Transcript_79228/g.220265  ORF Transcript_79228/g.220265 Transcript_79228/m.220265 type:complete len:268 (-) Transcript_79228:540-1343(-)